MTCPGQQQTSGSLGSIPDLPTSKPILPLDHNYLLKRLRDKLKSNLVSLNIYILRHLSPHNTYDSESAHERKIKQNFERNIIQYVFKVVNVKQFFKAPWKHIPSALLTGYFYPVLSLCISFLLPQIIANLMA